jgi:hypothetical protein
MQLGPNRHLYAHLDCESHGFGSGSDHHCRGWRDTVLAVGNIIAAGLWMGRYLHIAYWFSWLDGYTPGRVFLHVTPRKLESMDQGSILSKPLSIDGWSDLFSLLFMSGDGI